MSENNAGLQPLDTQNPTLLPNLNQPIVTAGGGVALQSPAAFIAANPRVAATNAVTVGGTETDGDVLTIKITNPVIVGGSVSVSVTAVTGDTLPTLAEKLAAAITKNSVCQAVNIFGTSLNGVVTVNQLGPVGNSSVVTGTVSVSATETLTPAASGVMSGGSGAIIPVANFVSAQGNNILRLRAFQPILLSAPELSSLVAAGSPII